MQGPGREPSRLRTPDGEGSGNPDPTMKKGPGSPKGENMPPAGGETMEPADSEHTPKPNADDKH